MRTIEDVRKSLGFQTAGEFAARIKIAPSNYSQMATGKKPVTDYIVMKLKSAFPNAEFDDLVSKNDTSITEEVHTRYYRSGHSLVFKNQSDEYRSQIYRPLPVIKVTDRAILPSILQTGLRDLEIYNVLHQNLQNFRADYFVLECGQEPHAEFVKTGDRLLCYEVRREDWFRIARSSVVLIYSTEKIDTLIQLTFNLLTFPDGRLEGGNPPIWWQADEITRIYKVEALLRKL